MKKLIDEIINNGGASLDNNYNIMNIEKGYSVSILGQEKTYCINNLNYNDIIEDLKQKQEEVTIVAPTKNEKLQTQKMVKVMLSKPHRCHIGGEWYSFQANKQYTVPEQVKKTLMKAGLLLPL